LEINELPMVAAASVDVSASVSGRFGRKRQLLPDIAMSAPSTSVAHRSVPVEQHPSL
jgi:hypothetical protein